MTTLRADTEKKTVKVWNPLVRIFHMSLLVAVGVAYVTQEQQYDAHIQSGYAVLGLVLFRIFWGMAGGRHARFAAFWPTPAGLQRYLKDMLRGQAPRYLGHNPAGGLMVIGGVVGALLLPALSALGFVLIYKSSRVLNIAHGQIIAAGAFITYALTVWVGIHIALSFILSMIITFFLAMSVERVFLRRLIGEPIISVIMVTIGLMSIIDGIIYMTPFGSENFSFPEFLPKTPLMFWGVSISWTQLVGLIITFIMIGGFTWFFKASTIGISMRAVSDDQFASMSIGISVPKVFGLAWAAAGLSAAAAGGIDHVHGHGIAGKHAVQAAHQLDALRDRRGIVRIREVRGLGALDHVDELGRHLVPAGVLGLGPESGARVDRLAARAPDVAVVHVVVVRNGDGRPIANDLSELPT